MIQLEDHSAVKKIIKQLQVMTVKIDIQRAELIKLIQAVDGKQFEKRGKGFHALLTYSNQWDRNY